MTEQLTEHDYRNAEHDAKAAAAIRRAGLIPWAHLGTKEPHA